MRDRTFYLLCGFGVLGAFGWADADKTAHANVPAAIIEADKPVVKEYVPTMCDLRRESYNRSNTELMLSLSRGDKAATVNGYATDVMAEKSLFVVACGHNPDD